MQTASANFAAAVSASSGVWAPPQVHADWANDGYGGDTSIDNLSDLAGRAIVVNQSFDDGMPSDVSMTAGKDPTPSIQFPVGGALVARVPFTGPQYWSIDNASSPISAYDRDVAALTVAHGLVTAGGIERVTVFTGQMLDVTVTGRTATLVGTSKTRMQMTRYVQPPAIIGDDAGLDATWPISWSLYQCGIYVSPSPRTGCRAWIPMHGSLTPFIDSSASFYGNFDARYVDATLAANNQARAVRPTFITGPYVSGAYAEAKTGSKTLINYPGPLPMASGTDLLSKAASAGRVEFWVRGDTADTVNTPGGVVNLVGAFNFETVAGDPTAAAATVGIGTDRKVFVHAQDGAGHSVTLKSSATLPTDGAWYFAGAAWDIAGKKLWVNLNGTVGSSAVSTFVTSSLPVTDAFDTSGGSPGTFQSYLPLAEVQISSGAQANPDNFVWVNDVNYAWTAGAVLRPSQMQLAALGEPKPREAWEFVNSFAQAELAMVRTDELDRFCYFTKGYWAETAQQTVVDRWDTTVNAGKDFTVTRDPSKTRNQVNLTYTTARVDDPISQRAILAVSFTVWVIPPFATVTFPLAFGYPALVPNSVFTLLNATQAAAAPFPTSYVCLNSASNGGGTYAAAGQVDVTIASWNPGSAVIQFVNHTGTTWYTANSGNAAFVQITGAGLAGGQSSVTVNDTASQSARGVRGMSVSLPAITDLATATRTANEILARSRLARKVLTVTLRGDPRRQPGDLVTFADPTNTQLGGSWRVMAIDHTIDGARHEQAVTAVQYWPVGVWDQTTWDNCVWGP